MSARNPNFPEPGAVFGRLTVLARAEDGAGRAARFRVRCECGREKEVFANALMNGTTWRCGRNCPIDTGMEPGRMFGGLVLVRKTVESSTQEGETWLCRCDCGGQVEATTRDLVRGKIKGCGGHGGCAGNGAVEGTRLGRLNQEPTASSSSGVRGVCVCRSGWRAGMYVAHIYVRGRLYDLGTYSDLERAAEARRAGEEALWDPILRRYGWPETSEERYRELLDAALADVKGRERAARKERMGEEDHR